MCVQTARLAILWNGEQTEWIEPTRGIRQGDTISQYLFMLCIERLSHLINSLVNEGKWKGIRLSRNKLMLSHLFFADDMVLFSEASSDQVDVINQCLSLFFRCSGPKVSKEKSQFFFSHNMGDEKATFLANRAGIPATKDLGRYLGVPSIHKAVKANAFNGIIDRIQEKLAG